MSKKEVELRISPENLLKDLKAIGVSVQMNPAGNLVVSGLTTALESGIITAGAKELILESVRALKSELIAFLRDSHDKDQA